MAKTQSATYVEVELPDGSIAEFPSDMSDAEISAAIRKTFNPQRQNKPQFNQNPFMSGITGFNTAFERPVQGLMQLATGNNWQGLRDVANKRESEYAKSMSANPGSTITGDILGNIGLGLPLGQPFNSLAGKLAPVVKNSPYAKNILGGGLGGAALGGAQYVEPEEYRLKNAGIGGATGAGFSAAIPGLARLIPMAGRGISRTLGNPERMIKDFIKNFTPEEMKQALQNSKIAKRLNVKRTPAELADNRIASAEEARLGSSDEGKRNLYEFNKLQKKLDEESIRKLLKDVSGSGENAYEPLRDFAKKIISKKEKALQERAKPYYDASKHQTIEASKLQELTNNGIIEQELRSVLDDKKYRSRIEGLDITSVGMLDIVKKRIDGLIGAAKRTGNKDDAALYQDAKDQLVSALDAVSPDYKKARAIYSEESPIIDLVRKRQIGKISRLNDDQIKQVGNIVFDSGDIDNKSIARMATEFGKESPETWNKIVRNYLENKMDTSYVGRTGYHGTNFYNQFLNQDKSFNKLTTALSGNPKAQEVLKDMRMVFKDIQNQPTARGAAAQARSHVDVSRDWLANIKKFWGNMTGGHYDKAMIDIITTDKWQKAFEKALKEPKKADKISNIMKLLDEINSVGARAASSKSSATKGPFMSTENYDIYEDHAMGRE